MPFLSFGKKNKKEVALVLDIGSGSVAGSFVEFAPKLNPRVLYTRRVPMKVGDTLSSLRFRKAMTTALSTVLDDLNQTGLTYVESSSKNRIKYTYCSLASPWFVSQTKTLRIKKETPFIVSEEFISNLLEREVENFENSDLSKYSSNKRQASEVIERKIIDVTLNGYKDDNPFGKKAREVEISLFMSMSPSSVLDEIEEMILKSFHIDEIGFHSFTLVSFSAIRDMYDAVSSFIILDITGEVTDISLIKSGNILRTMSFPIGKNSLIRDVANSLGTTPSEALSRLRLFVSDSLNISEAEKMKKITLKSVESWQGEFRQALVSIAGSLALPKTIFFTTDEDLSAWYGGIIKSEEFTQSSMTHESFVVSFITPYSLDSYVSFRDKKMKDSFIAIESVFFNRLFEVD